VLLKLYCRLCLVGHGERLQYGHTVVVPCDSEIAESSGFETIDGRAVTFSVCSNAFHL
jgi:hypothetical protein